MKDLLIEIGFTENEASLYAALCSLKQATAAELITHSGVKRVTAYPILKRLVANGMVRQVNRGKRYSFAVGDTDALIRVLDHQEAEVARKKQRLLTALAAGDQDGLVTGREAVAGLLEKVAGEAEAGSEMYEVRNEDLLKRLSLSEHARVAQGILSKRIYTAAQPETLKMELTNLQTSVYLTKEDLQLPGFIQVHPGWGVTWGYIAGEAGVRSEGGVIRSHAAGKLFAELCQLAWEGALVRKLRNDQQPHAKK